MSSERLFLDATYLQAILNRADQHHMKAVALIPLVKADREVWPTEAVRLGVGAAMSAVNRTVAVVFLRSLYRTPNTHFVPMGEYLFRRGQICMINRSFIRDTVRVASTDAEPSVAQHC